VLARHGSRPSNNSATTAAEPIQRYALIFIRKRPDV
jgi:hypothetical protein